MGKGGQLYDDEQKQLLEHAHLVYTEVKKHFPSCPLILE